MHTLSLFISALISPWQFFQETVPSPRIEYTLATTQAVNENWQEFCLRPKALSFLETFRSLFFNPKWNNALYIYDCAEQLVIKPSDYYQQLIELEIRKKLDLKPSDNLIFRISYLTKLDSGFRKDILYQSNNLQGLGL